MSHSTSGCLNKIWRKIVRFINELLVFEKTYWRNAIHSCHTTTAQRPVTTMIWTNWTLYNWWYFCLLHSSSVNSEWKRVLYCNLSLRFKCSIITLQLYDWRVISCAKHYRKRKVYEIKEKFGSTWILHKFFFVVDVQRYFSRRLLIYWKSHSGEGKSDAIFQFNSIQQMQFNRLT